MHLETCSPQQNAHVQKGQKQKRWISTQTNLLHKLINSYFMNV